jgi:ribosomal protein S18 acetylase RimI-like enzyme
LEGERTGGTIATWKEHEGPTDVLVGPKTFTFSVAATRPECRGRGIGAALTWTCLAHGRDQGFDHCYTDWISPNLAASRFWPRFGFKEVAYRLTKQINPMIAWTRDTG